ncbi:MAG: zinc chelation protein SecC [Moraxellaceae bacterium]|nr:MAG: zinc chelation protein SecC [Moraxellaceae bacterium]
MGNAVDNTPCPCGSNSSYQQCCQRFHSGADVAFTAKQLMRSRYCAFVKRNVPYLLKTRHSSTQSQDDPQQLQQSCQNTQWLGLNIHHCQQGLAKDSVGTVSFSAHYRESGSVGVLSETSRFIKEGQRWYYVDGKVGEDHQTQEETEPLNKPGRNEPCWCGSGKKFKRCHG